MSSLVHPTRGVSSSPLDTEPAGTTAENVIQGPQSDDTLESHPTAGKYAVDTALVSNFRSDGQLCLYYPRLLILM